MMMLLLIESLFLWIVVGLGLWWILCYTSDSVPAHHQGKRYQELRKRPEENELVVVRSFHYRRNAMKWIKHCEVFRGTLEFRDSKTGRILYQRELD